MKRNVLPFLVCLIALAAGAAPASASDASLKSALKVYEKRLTSDISYLANFSAPNKSAANAALRKLPTVRGDLTGAAKAASQNQASTPNGAKGRTEIISALQDALTAATAARSSAGDVRDGRRAAAKTALKQEQREIGKAIPLFESGGKALHLF